MRHRDKSYNQWSTIIKIGGAISQLSLVSFNNGPLHDQQKNHIEEKKLNTKKKKKRPKYNKTHIFRNSEQTNKHIPPHCRQHCTWVSP